MSLICVSLKQDIFLRNCVVRVSFSCPHCFSQCCHSLLTTLAGTSVQKALFSQSANWLARRGHLSWFSHLSPAVMTISFASIRFCDSWQMYYYTWQVSLTWNSDHQCAFGSLTSFVCFSPIALSLQFTPNFWLTPNSGTRRVASQRKTDNASTLPPSLASPLQLLHSPGDVVIFQPCQTIH